MDKEEAGEATTVGEIRRWGSDEPIRALPGREIDARPDPAGVRALRRPEYTRKQLEEMSAADLAALKRGDWPEGHTTGAFVSAAASIRHEVKPYRWWDRISPGMLALWGGFVGVPAVAGVWAVYEVWRRVHGS